MAVKNLALSYIGLLNTPNCLEIRGDPGAAPSTRSVKTVGSITITGASTRVYTIVYSLPSKLPQHAVASAGPRSRYFFLIIDSQRLALEIFGSHRGGRFSFCDSRRIVVVAASNCD